MWAAVAVLLLSGVFQAGGEYFSKIWGLSPHWHAGIIAVVLYAISSAIWLPALLYRDQLSTIGIAWDVIAISATLFLGIIVFHETLTPTQWLGVVLAIIALWLLLR
jgi:multidrug transporter EmrE-like cation transporter